MKNTNRGGAPGAGTPQRYARAIGVLYLLVIVLGGFAYGYVPGKLTSADAAVTAARILAHPLLWRTGIVAALIVVVCALPQLLLEYLLLRPVQRHLALLAVLFNLLSLTVETLANLGFFAALFLLEGRGSLGMLGVRPLEAWASLAIRLHDATLDVSFLFFGATCLAYGWLISRSRFLPRFLGALMTLAGACYAANSLLSFYGLQAARGGVPLLLLPAGLAELTLCLWLLFVGVDEGRWYERAGRPPADAPPLGTAVA